MQVPKEDVHSVDVQSLLSNTGSSNQYEATARVNDVGLLLTHAGKRKRDSDENNAGSNIPDMHNSSVSERDEHPKGSPLNPFTGVVKGYDTKSVKVSIKTPQCVNMKCLLNISINPLLVANFKG